MKKQMFAVLVLAILAALVSPAIAADTPPPLHNDQGTWIRDETHVAGKMDPALELYLGSDAHGWRPSADKVMKPTTGPDGKQYYHSAKRIPKGGKFHPFQMVGKKAHFLEIEHAHASEWMGADYVTDPCTYINPK
jgi:hypothetical protein